MIHAINLAYDLLQKFPNATIGYLTAYGAQTRLGLAAKDKMLAADPKDPLSIMRRFQVKTWDSSQGGEFNIVIMDILILLSGAGRHTAGFNDVANRLNVAFSRAMMGFYLLSSKDMINGCQRVKWLGKFHSAMFPYRVEMPFESVMPSSLWYVPGTVDLRELSEVRDDLFEVPDAAATVEAEDEWGVPIQNVQPTQADGNTPDGNGLGGNGAGGENQWNAEQIDAAGHW